MSEVELSRFAAESLYLVLWVSAPALVVSLAAGLVAGIAQASTQVQEQTLSFVPKLVAVALTLALAGGWMTRTLVAFARAIFETIPGLSR